MFGVLLAVVALQERIPAGLDLQLVSRLSQLLGGLLDAGLDRVDLSKSSVTT